MSTNSSKISQLFVQYEQLQDINWFWDVSTQLSENYNAISQIQKPSINNLNIANLQQEIDLLKNHKVLIEKANTVILQKYTNQDISEANSEISKRINILSSIVSVQKQINAEAKLASSPTDSSTNNKDNSTSTQLATSSQTPATLPELWGIKFTPLGDSNNYYMSLLPARQSTIAIQGGRDVPNAMPGLNFKFIPAVGKQQIIGFSPVFQNLGIKGMQIIIVGMFTGADGSNLKTDNNSNQLTNSNPFFNRATGNPSPSDNPVRGFSDLNAYNSYLEFMKLARENKQLDVEINLYQVYQVIEKSPFAEELKLQSITGNPKFTGVIRSLDVYHATKERTWYTLIMDVTDFNMASKEPINLNNKLAEAIKKAQEETAKANQAQAEQSQINEQGLPNPDTSNLTAEQKKEKLELFKWVAKQTKQTSTSPNFINAKNNSPILTQIADKRTFSYSQLIPLTDKSVLFRLASNCNLLYGGIDVVKNVLQYEYTIVPLPNLPSQLPSWINPRQYINKLFSNMFDAAASISLEMNNRSLITCDTDIFVHFNQQEALKVYIVKGNFSDRPSPSNPSFYGSVSQLNSLLNKKAQRLSIAEFSTTIAEALGCVGLGVAADATAGAIIGTIVPGAGNALGATIGGIKGLLQSAAFCSLGVPDSLYKRYIEVNKTNDEDDFGKQLVSSINLQEALVSFALQTGLSAVSSGIVASTLKRGSTVAISNTTSQLTKELAEDLLTNSTYLNKTINYNGFPVKITSVSKQTIDGIEQVVVNVSDISNGGSLAIPASEITEQLNKLGIYKPPVTITKPNPPTQSTPITITNPIDQAIDNTPLSESIKVSIKQQSNKDKIIELFNQTQIGRSSSKDINLVTSRGTIPIKATDNVTFTNTGVSINNATYAYSEIQSSQLVSIQPTVPQQPQPQNPVPQQSSQNTQTSSSTTVSSTIQTPFAFTGRTLEGFNKLKPYIGKQLVNGKKIAVTLKNGTIHLVDTINIQYANNVVSNSLFLANAILWLASPLAIIAGFYIGVLEDIDKVEEK